MRWGGGSKGEGGKEGRKDRRMEEGETRIAGQDERARRRGKERGDVWGQRLKEQRRRKQTEGRGRGGEEGRQTRTITPYN